MRFYRRDFFFFYSPGGPTCVLSCACLKLVCPSCWTSQTQSSPTKTKERTVSRDDRKTTLWCQRSTTWTTCSSSRSSMVLILLLLLLMIVILHTRSCNNLVKKKEVWETESSHSGPISLSDDLLCDFLILSHHWGESLVHTCLQYYFS